jgi:hypothetical protein
VLFTLLVLAAAPCPDPLAPVDVSMSLEEQTIALVRFGPRASGDALWDLPREGDGLEQFIEGSQATVRSCYETALSKEPELKSTWRLSTVVDREGVLRNVSVTPESWIL